MARAEVSTPVPVRAVAGGVHVRRLVRSLDVVLPATVIGLIVGACFLWPLIGNVPPPVGGDVLESNLPPLSQGHLLGTDPLGNDTWSRLLHGGRASLQIALSVQIVGLIAGGSLGAFAAYVGGVADTIVMRVLDVLIAFPALVLALAVAQSLGASKINTIWALSFFSVPSFGRIARAATLRLREQPFMVAAGLSGTRTRRVLVRHVAPNILPQLITFALLGMGVTIIIAGALSFLGLGVPQPNPSWGNMISAGQQQLSANPGLVLAPSIFLFATVLSFNLLGEALRSRWSGQ